jgi:hypothetical protein
MNRRVPSHSPEFLKSLPLATQFLNRFVGIKTEGQITQFFTIFISSEFAPYRTGSAYGRFLSLKLSPFLIAVCKKE